ncbi:hypothetical protein [Neobacillus sp.]|uniref:hypothetical protein n=1 Tax=Neobacillus sp. TaxID=2675273 RepID=UPI00289C5330|nr:hypothetical protein [Neobacillus sp.]
MFIRAFIQAKTKIEAETHLKALIVLAEKVHLKLGVTNFEPYWKYDDSFQMELNGTNPTGEQLSKFLGGIATRWSSFSDSYLASKTLEGCNILLGNFDFIEIFPNEN